MYFAEHRPIIIPKWQFLFIRAFWARQVQGADCSSWCTGTPFSQHLHRRIHTLHRSHTGNGLFVPHVNRDTSNFPAEKRDSNLPRNFYIFNDLVWLWHAAMICFCCFPCHILNTADLRIYTSDKHFVRSQFILIAPLCQRLLMIFYRTLHSMFHRRLFVLDWRVGCSDLDADQTTFHLWELVITQPFWCRAHSWKGAQACFASLRKCFNCLHVLQKQTNRCQTRVPHLHSIWEKQVGSSINQFKPSRSQSQYSQMLEHHSWNDIWLVWDYCGSKWSPNVC